MAVKASVSVTVFHVADGEDGANGKMLYGICSDSGATRTVTIDGVSSYEEGLTIAVKFTVTTSGSMTLNVNSLGAKTVYFNNTSTGGYCLAGYMVILVYETSTKSDGCWKAAYSYNSDTYDRTRYNGSIKASSAITGGNLIVGNLDGFFHLKTGNAFDVTYPILYAGSSIASGSTGTNCYTEISLTITTTQSITLTAYKTVYIKGNLSGNTFKPVDTAPLTQTEPTSEDGYYYILLGCAYSKTGVRLYPEHRIYKYFGGEFQVWNGAQDTADTAREEAADAAKTATNYLYYDTSGLYVGDKSSGSWASTRAKITSSAFSILNSSGSTLASFGTSISLPVGTITLGDTTDYNTYISSSGIDLRYGTTAYTSVTSSAITIGNPDEFNTYIDTDGVDIRSGSTVLASFESDKLTLGATADVTRVDICNGAFKIYALDAIVALRCPDAEMVLATNSSLHLDSAGVFIDGGSTYGVQIGDSDTANQLNVYGAITGTSTLTVAGATTLKSTLSVTGAITGSSTLVTASNISVGNTSVSSSVYRRITVLNSVSSCCMEVGPNGSGVYAKYGSYAGWLVRMTTSGTITTGTTSDRRLKNYLGDVTTDEATALLENVKPINFTYKGDTVEVGNGFFAQDVLQVLKDYNIGYRSYLRISNNTDNRDIYELDHNENEVVYGLDYSKFVPVLWKGWQIHKSEIDELKEQNVQLRVQIEDLAFEITTLKKNMEETNYA